MLKGRLVWAVLKKTALLIKINILTVVILAICTSPSVLGKEFNPQEEFNLSNDWKVINYGLDEVYSEMIGDAKLAFKDSINGVMLQLLVDPSNFETTLIKVTKTNNGGNRWDSLIYLSLPITSAVYDIAYYNKNIIFLESEVVDYPDQPAGETKLWLSNDDGNTWKKEELQYFEDGIGLDHHKTKIVIMNDSVYLILYKYDLIRTTNYGKDWVNIKSVIPWVESHQVHRFIDIERNNQELYLLTMDSSSNIKYSENIGESWTANTKCGLLPWIMNDLIIENKNNFFVLGGKWDKSLKSWHDTLFVTSNSGITWNVLNANLLPDHHKGLYCGESGFLVYYSPQYTYYSSDLKKPFTNIGGDKFSDKYFLQFDDAEYIGNNKVILVDKYFGNVWSYTIPASSIIEKDQSDNLQIIPNPANDFITITLKPTEGFEPSEGSEIQIFNTFGEKVLSASARHAVPLRINISALPKGMYFVKAGGETAKFVKM